MLDLIRRHSYSKSESSLIKSAFDFDVSDPKSLFDKVLNWAVSPWITSSPPILLDWNHTETIAQNEAEVVIRYAESFQFVRMMFLVSLWCSHRARAIISIEENGLKEFYKGILQREAIKSKVFTHCPHCLRLVKKVVCYIYILTIL